MSTFKAAEFNSKSGKIGLIRSAEQTDAAALLQLAKEVMAEEIYMLTTPEELSHSIEEEAKWINDHTVHPANMILVATIGSEVVGNLNFSVGHRQRIAHTGDFGMSIAKAYRGEGIGSILLRTLLEWARNHPSIEKVYLKVHSTNARAISLYKKFGFIEEGRLLKDLKYGDSNYVDTVIMSNFTK